MRWDPRHYQIIILTVLLAYGLLGLDFEVSGLQVALTLGVALTTQTLATRFWKLPRYEFKSALISSLSLCLLLRSSSLSLIAVGAMLTILSKFVLRYQNRHLFNPTNFAIVVLLLLSDQVWVSPGQWGHGAYLAFLLAGLGGIVIHRATRSDVTYAFLFFYLTLVFGYAWYLGDPLAIPLHRMQSGAFLLFTFLMISDPKTTPNSRTGRIVFAGLVALGAWAIQYQLFQQNGLFWSLAFVSMLTPVLNKIFPGKTYEWTHSTKQGDHHEKNPLPTSKPHPGLAIATTPRSLLRLLRGQGRHQTL